MKVFVCKKCKNADCLMRVLKHSESKLVPVGCQKICSGPVVGLKVDGRMEWFSRVDSLKALAGVRGQLGRPHAGGLGGSTDHHHSPYDMSW